MPERLVITLLASVPAALLENHMAIDPELVTEAMVAAATQAARETGYFPVANTVDDPELVGTFTAITELAADLFRANAASALRRDFAIAEVLSVFPVALGLPPVRHGDINAGIKLARHYTPNRLRVTLSLLPRSEQGAEAAAAALGRLFEDVHLP